jgi:hypothetical protein
MPWTDDNDNGNGKMLVGGSSQGASKAAVAAEVGENTEKAVAVREGLGRTLRVPRLARSAMRPADDESKAPFSVSCPLRSARVVWKKTPDPGEEFAEGAFAHKAPNQEGLGCSGRTRSGGEVGRVSPRTRAEAAAESEDAMGAIPSRSSG